MSDLLNRRVAALNQRYKGAETAAMLADVIKKEFNGQLSLVSSFGAESAVLLHLVAEVAPDIDVVFVDTGKLFGETKAYRDQLIARLGLTNVRTVTPRKPFIDKRDPKGRLWAENPNLCCFLRRVEPLERALEGVEVWISGRKRFQSNGRAGLPLFEVQDGRIKINPLAGWTKEELDQYFEDHDLPRHPLEADGFLSIGCMPCTDRVKPGEDIRAGRWRGRDKDECGIHVNAG